MVSVENIYKIFNDDDKQYIKDNIIHWMGLYSGKVTPSNSDEEEFLQRVKNLDINIIEIDSDEGLFIRYLERYRLLEKGEVILSDEKTMMEECFTGWGNIGIIGDFY